MGLTIGAKIFFSCSAMCTKWVLLRHLLMLVSLNLEKYKGWVREYLASSRATVPGQEYMSLAPGQGYSSRLCQFCIIQLHGVLFPSVDMIHVTVTSFW